MRSRLPVVALIAATLITAGCGIDDPYQPTATRTETTAKPSTAPVSSDASEVKPDLSPPQRDAHRRAESAARAFLTGYLPYSYGRATARRILAATPALRHELAGNPPHVSARTMRTAHPLVRQLRVSGLNGSRAYVLAQVDDGSRTYATSLTIERHGHRWLVATVA